MRTVSDPSDLPEAFHSCKSEAEKAFGDGSLYLEKHLESPRHVEFQILADSFGNVVHLFERECSIQRRHQKIIEETPSPALTPELRRQMGQAAVAAARAAGYVNAGTVEFLLDREGQFLLSGSEHPAAGGASYYRGHDRPRSGPPPIGNRRRAGLAFPAGRDTAPGPFL